MIAWIKRTLGRRDVAPSANPVAPKPAPADEPPELALLRALSTGDEVASARVTTAFASLAGGPHERAALEALIRAARAGRGSPSVFEACAEALVRRGQTTAALSLLADTTTVTGLALRADALASLGELAAACAALEAALARDVRAPGLAERRAALRARMGLVRAAPLASSASATLVTAVGPRLAYRVVGEAGRGGAATVYQAEDDALGRTIALKLYHQPRDHAEQVAREARVAIAVAGPFVVRVLDASLDQGWIALGWAARGSLRDALASSDHALADPRIWAPGVARALARVHAKGWVHGDVKPGNVLFRADASPLLADFGLARRVGESFSGGTPGYLSPERRAGAPATPRDDVYAFGKALADACEVAGSVGARALAAALLSRDRPPDAGAIDLRDLA